MPVDRGLRARSFGLSIHAAPSSVIQANANASAPSASPLSFEVG
jgi:hypothetical protein